MNERTFGTSNDVSCKNIYVVLKDIPKATSFGSRRSVAYRLRRNDAALARTTFH
jgi:hypothetical protein